MVADPESTASAAAELVLRKDLLCMVLPNGLFKNNQLLGSRHEGFILICIFAYAGFPFIL
jgi:hypothetical protein